MAPRGWCDDTATRISETSVAPAPPEVVFDYTTDPANLASWQTSKALVEPLTEGPTWLGSRVRERTRPPGSKEFEQIVEFTEFDRPRRFHVHIVEGPYPIDGTWSLQPDAAGTHVTFVAEGELQGWMCWVSPLAGRADRPAVRRVPPQPVPEPGVARGPSPERGDRGQRARVPCISQQTAAIRPAEAT